MRKLPALAAATALVIICTAPSALQAWGMDVHRWITRRALDNMPADLGPFFQAKRDFISEHSADPDLWRVVGLKGSLGEEDPNHYLDIDALDEPVPFTKVPRDLAAFIDRYGPERAAKMGRLPWRAEEVSTRLVAAF